MYYFILDKMILPITPESVEYSYSGQNKTYTLINEGEVNVLKDSRLEDITFDFLIPAQSYPFATVKIHAGQQVYIDWLEKLKRDKKPFQFIIVRFRPDYMPMRYTNIKVSLEDYALRESADEGFDVVARVKLKRYKPFGTKIITANDDGTATIKNIREAVNSPMPTSTTEYTVKSGDSLWKIAKNTYGDGSKYTEIAKANGMTSTTVIHAGQKLILPKL